MCVVQRSTLRVFQLTSKHFVNLSTIPKITDLVQIQPEVLIHAFALF